jgi:hypothetical protein
MFTGSRISKPYHQLLEHIDFPNSVHLWVTSQSGGLKGTLARDFRPQFLFTNRPHLGPCFMVKIIFEYKCKFAEIFKFKSHSVWGPNTWKEIFFFVLGHYKKLFLFGFRSKSSPSLHFLKYCPSKSCEEKKFHSEYLKFWGAVSKYAEWNLPHADNTQNEIHHILIIRGMKFSAHC